ncbi:conserved hypothetical protein [Talaromyces stipitatus ATCC 10500]|uniref:Hepatocellular carcinoma-associated antigen 59-domain-containing protein n=1 Tax=Talaromyces stipitatus (strain ATCC 10500 / CBS 375.48 / QM 6759 / NRRL 1006) TaxID=441959 RepID=B8LT88_TALSN|nr:uncharacterized protein TSTA_070100 [Talaromyces stipitatus ATCC 10500]EED23596.1 conserved hypothetical protein [Talaromyces stipitatus ATCC 10500]
MDTEISEVPIVSFRPVKRHKFLRKRLDESDDVSTPDNAATEYRAASEEGQAYNGELQDEGNENEVLSKIMRPRKFQRMRRGGIEFSTSSAQPVEKNDSLALTAEPTEADIIKAKLDRFTAHTGQKVDVDKHMMEYIESEMARRQNLTQAERETSTAGRLDKSNANDSFSNAFSKREPATLGKLHEIDLGQETKLQNIARTEAATRRMAGESPDAVDESPSLGQNGKPWRNRRRNSKDIERDRLVEEVLRESKLDVYDEPEQSPTYDDQAADDRIAEQFRRDFMEAIQSRRRTQRNRTTTTTTNKRVAKPEPPRGPKLGGSRSARAAMREMQEKGAKK